MTKVLPQKQNKVSKHVDETWKKKKKRKTNKRPLCVWPPASDERSWSHETPSVFSESQMWIQMCLLDHVYRGAERSVVLQPVDKRSHPLRQRRLQLGNVTLRFRSTTSTTLSCLFFFCFVPDSEIPCRRPAPTLRSDRLLEKIKPQQAAENRADCGR